MKKYLFMFILISAVVLVSGCTDSLNNTTGSSDNNTKTYSGDEVTFEYPGTWETISSQSRDTVVAVGDPNSADANGNTRINVVIQRAIKPQTSTLKDYYNATYTQFASQNLGFIPISDGTILVNGQMALENIYKINNNGQKEERAIWVQKGNKIFIILCSAPVSDFNNQQGNFDKIVNSFKAL